VVNPTGETDVDTRWVADDGTRYGILCEVKLAAQFMPKQGERYQLRAADMARGGQTRAALAVLIAHSSYLRTASPEARWFDRTVRLDELPGWVRRDTTPQLADEVGVLGEAVTRMAEGKPLGAKGLHTDLYRAVADECVRRRNSLTITNRPTDWIYLKHPRMNCTGVNINYRVRDAIPEIRIWGSFKGDRDGLVRACVDPVMPVVSGTHLFLRLPALEVTAGAKSGAVTDAELASIVDACEWLAGWWSQHYRARPGAELGAAPDRGGQS
jgi:hypothetical protein